MGNNNSHPKHSTNPDFLTLYKQTKKQSNSLLGQISEALELSTNKSFLMKIYSFVDQSSFKNTLKILKTRINQKLNPQKYLINLRHIQQMISKQYCGSIYRIYTLYDHIQRDLLEIYNQKIVNSQKFTQQQLSCILQICINALIYLQDNGLKKYHICKRSIVMSNNTFRLLEFSLIIKQHPYFCLLNDQKIDEDIFLAPELLFDLEKRSYDPYLSPKTDIYTLGVLLIHLALQQSLAQFYDYQKCKIDSLGLIKKVSQITQLNQWFKTLIITMIQSKQDIRPGLITIKQKLQTNKKQFTQKKNIDYNQMSKNRSANKQENNNKFKGSILNLKPSKTSGLWNKDHKKNIITQKEQQKKKQLSPQKNKFNVFSKYTNMPSIMNPKQKINNQNSNKKLQPTIYSTTTTSYGRIDYSDGKYYDGQLSNQQPHGTGINYFKNSSIQYSGSWSKNKYHGFGTLYNQNPKNFQKLNEVKYEDLGEFNDYWLKYEGQFVEGQKQGFGTLFITNGEKFSGCFKKGVAQGYGAYYKNDGNCINGLWSGNKFKKN